jgi:hypothetical protein
MLSICAKREERNIAKVLQAPGGIGEEEETTSIKATYDVVRFWRLGNRKHSLLNAFDVVGSLRKRRKNKRLIQYGIEVLQAVHFALRVD